MSYKFFSLPLILCTALLLFSSCSEEEELLNLQNSTETSQNLQLTPNRGNNSSPGQNSISSLDNQITQEWMTLFLNSERYALGMRPNASARALAYINLAAYETAVPGMRDFVSNSDQLPQFRIRGEINIRNMDWEIALNACYADVIKHFLLNVPNDVEQAIDALETANEDRLSPNVSTTALESSINWGARVAQQVIAYSQTDTEAEEQILEPQPLSYEPPTGDGNWTYSAEQERALFPYWSSVRTFIVSTDETTSLPPIPYSENPNSAYFKEMKAVYHANNEARTEDGDALWIAEFWSDDVENITFSPPSRQIAIANQLIDQFSLNLEETLHLYVKLGFSLNDAAVSTWKYKYEHMVMRPNVFIHEFIDPSYQTNLYRLIPWPNPTFPGYPSGHSCFASAAAGVFIDQFGSQINFTDRSHEGRTEFRSSPRTFNSFEEMAKENAYSRIPLGVHIDMDCTEGLRLGYEISNRINRHSLRRRRNA